MGSGRLTALQRQQRRGTTAEHSTFTGAAGEVTVDTTKDTAVVHDGATAGGHPLAKEGHSHSKSDISDFSDGDYATAAQGSNADTAHGWGNHATAGYITGVAWADVTGKPALATVATTGAYNDLSGLPSLFDGAYSSLSGVPSTFAPSAHTHTIANVTGLQAALDGKEPANADILKADIADQLTAGFTSALDDDGTQSSGTYTADPATGLDKAIVNGGAFSIGVPAAAAGEVVYMTIHIVNNASAGAITTSGFTKVSGDDFTTANGDAFLCSIRVQNKGGTITSRLFVEAQQ